MTGEMYSINRDGTDSNGETWETHAYIARKLRRPLRPFDSYIGPYIACKEGRLWLSSDDGCSGTVCLWPNGIAPAYCEPIVRHVWSCQDSEATLEAARACLAQYRKQARATLAQVRS